MWPWLISIGLTLITLLVGTTGCPGPKVGPAAGDQPIIISDGSLYMKSTNVAFNSWPNNNANQPTEIDPNYSAFNGVDVVVDGSSVNGCPSNAACEINIWYEDANAPTVHFNYNPGGNYKLVLKSDRNSFDTYYGFSEGQSVIFNPVKTKIKKVTVNGGGNYQPHASCKITIHVQ